VIHSLCFSSLKLQFVQSTAAVEKRGLENIAIIGPILQGAMNQGDKRYKRNNIVASWRVHKGSGPSSELRCPGYCGERSCLGDTGETSADSGPQDWGDT